LVPLKVPLAGTGYRNGQLLSLLPARLPHRSNPVVWSQGGHMKDLWCRHRRSPAHRDHAWNLAYARPRGRTFARARYVRKL